MLKEKIIGRPKIVRLPWKNAEIVQAAAMRGPMTLAVDADAGRGVGAVRGPRVVVAGADDELDTDDLIIVAVSLLGPEA